MLAACEEVPGAAARSKPPEWFHYPRDSWGKTKNTAPWLRAGNRFRDSPKLNCRMKEETPNVEDQGLGAGKGLLT